MYAATSKTFKSGLEQWAHIDLFERFTAREPELLDGFRRAEVVLRVNACKEMHWQLEAAWSVMHAHSA